MAPTVSRSRTAVGVWSDTVGPLWASAGVLEVVQPGAGVDPAPGRVRWSDQPASIRVMTSSGTSALGPG